MSTENQIDFTVTKQDERLYLMMAHSDAADYTTRDGKYVAHSTLFRDPLGWRVRCLELDIDRVYPDLDQAMDQARALIDALIKPVYPGVENMTFHRNSGGWLAVEGDYGVWRVEACKAPYSPVWVAEARRGNMRVSGSGDRLQNALEILLDNVDMVTSKMGAK